jgi:tetratricopeptide (TPR) repeat protein
VLDWADRAAAHWQAAKAGARERATAIRLRGLGHRLKGDYPAALTAYREALDLYRSRSAESKDISLTLNDIAAVERLSGKFGEAEQTYREALRVARAVGYAEGEASTPATWLTLPWTKKTGCGPRPWPGRRCLWRRRWVARS